MVDKRQWPEWQFVIWDADDQARYNFRAPDDDTATHVGRGMAFIDGWCAEGTQSNLIGPL